jgi:GH15 family glucan-1,4-alpha-glucosidase
MARPIVLSNGELHVGINDFGLVHDFHYPFVGLENHTLGRGLRHRVGVWIDGILSWLDDGSWELDFTYPHTALIGHTIATNKKLNVRLEFDDFVDCEKSAFVRAVHVINTSDRDRNVRVFMHQAFVIGDSRGNTDTARYLPDSEALLHYRGDRVFVISGQMTESGSFDQYSVGLFGIEGHEGTWRDAEDGDLSMCNVEHGRVDSVLRFNLEIAKHSSKRLHYWIAAGTSLRSALHTHQMLRDDGVIVRMNATAEWWQTWLKPVVGAAQRMPKEYQHEFIMSAMILRSQIDNHGAIIASTDSAMLNYGRDAYAYSWPRDGAYTIWPLIRLGYTDEPVRFFDFCRRGLHPRGYLSHKYRSDGALGSSWHSYLHEGGIVAPPIQEDETALVLFIFCEYYHMHTSDRLLSDYYESFVQPMANFLADYIDDDTHLPRPSYDLWEEKFATTTYTVAITYAALLAAAVLAEKTGDNTNAVIWRSAADDMQRAARKHLYRPGIGYFAKSLYHAKGATSYDDTIDISSFYACFMFGLF